MKKNIGKIISLKGGAVEIIFKGKVPPIHTLLKDVQGKIFFDIIEKKDNHIVKAVTLSSLEGVERGTKVEVDGQEKEISVELSQKILGRMFDLFGKPIDNKKFIAKTKIPLYKNEEEKLDGVNNENNILETGIKVIDLLTPFRLGDKVGLFGGGRSWKNNSYY